LPQSGSSGGMKGETWRMIGRMIEWESAMNRHARPQPSLDNFYITSLPLGFIPVYLSSLCVHCNQPMKAYLEK
jgi:hypothetical protein